jgi:ATP-dependent RNA helicase RhlE
MPLSTAVVFGGVPIGPQRQKLARGVDILVATPGRLLDLIDTRSLTLSSVQVLVLDEADSKRVRCFRDSYSNCRRDEGR